jgi:hypothetical protein
MPTLDRSTNTPSGAHSGYELGSSRPASFLKQRLSPQKKFSPSIGANHSSEIKTISPQLQMELSDLFAKMAVCVNMEEKYKLLDKFRDKGIKAANPTERSVDLSGLIIKETSTHERKHTINYQNETMSRGTDSTRTPEQANYDLKILSSLKRLYKMESNPKNDVCLNSSTNTIDLPEMPCLSTNTIDLPEIPCLVQYPNDFPNELVLEIFKFLIQGSNSSAVKDVVNFSGVCKSFHNVVQSFSAFRCFLNTIILQTNPMKADAICKFPLITRHPNNNSLIMRIDISGVLNLHDDLMEKIGLSCPDLQFITMGSLDDRNAKISDAGITILSQLCPKLQSVMIKCPSALTDVALVNLSITAPNLRELSITHMAADQPEVGYSISNIGVLALLHGCKQLTHLTIGKSAQNSSGSNISMELFSLIETTLSLETLSLTYCMRPSLPLCDEGLDDLSAKCPDLKRLELSSKDGIQQTTNLVTDDGLTRFFGRCKKITHLRLGKFTRLSEEFLTSMSSLCPQLRGIDLSGLSFSAEKLKKILSGWPLLEELFLDHCKLKDPLNEALQYYPNVKGLSVEGVTLSAGDYGFFEDRTLSKQRSPFPSQLLEELPSEQ